MICSEHQVNDSKEFCTACQLEELQDRTLTESVKVSALLQSLVEAVNRLEQQLLALETRVVQNEHKVYVESSRQSTTNHQVALAIADIRVSLGRRR